MPRRRRRPRAAGGGSEPESGPASFARFLAAELYGNNPRLPVAGNGGTALLKIEPAPNTRLYYTRRGERVALDGVVGAALVLEDPDEVLEFDDNGRLRIRVLSVDELEAFAWRLLRYAAYLRLVNALGLDVRELASIYFNGEPGAGRGRGRGRRVAEPEPEEAGEEPEASVDEVEAP